MRLVPGAAAVGEHHHEQRRSFIVPMQLKAYGGSLNHAGSSGLEGFDPTTHLAQLDRLPGPKRSRTVTTFAEMDLDPRIRDAMGAMGVTVPSPPQQAAIRPLLQRSDLLVAAPAGTGKTLAGLAPILSNLLQDRDEHRIPLRENRPRCIVVSPTAELIEQTADVCRQLGLDSGVTVLKIGGDGRRWRRKATKNATKRNLFDVVVATPHMIVKLLRAKRLSLEDLRYLVVDEADTLLSAEHRGYGRRLCSMVYRRMRYKHLWPVETQRVLLTAGVTASLAQSVSKEIGDMPHVTVNHTHELNPRVTQRFLRVGRKQSHMPHLEFLLKQSGNHPDPLTSDDPEIVRARRAAATPQPYSPVGSSLPEAHQRLQREAAVRRYAPPDPRLLLLDPAKRGWGGRPAPQQPPDEGATSADKSKALVVGTVDEEGEGGGEDAVAAPPDLHRKQEVAASGAQHHNPAGLNDAVLVNPAECVWEHLTTTSAPFTGPIKREVVVPGERVLIFFNTIEAATAIYHRLKGAGYSVAVLFGTQPQAVRYAMLRHWARGDCNILCTTDNLARGVDYRVDRVINFDCPSNVVQYLHRAGRTARMGRTGKVDTLYTSRNDAVVGVLREFRRGGIALEKVANVTRQVTLPTYSDYRRQKKDAVGRSYVRLLTQQRVTPATEKKFLRLQATWRPLYHPQTVEHHSGIAPWQQSRERARMTELALWRRREVEAKRKGGRAKFGRATPGERPERHPTHPVRVHADTNGSSSWGNVPRSPL